MTVRDSSKEVFRELLATGRFASMTEGVFEYVRRNGNMTRRMIATDLEMETASVSSIVNHLIKHGQLEESLVKRPCRDTAKRVYWVRSKPKQETLL